MPSISHRWPACFLGTLTMVVLLACTSLFPRGVNTMELATAEPRVGTTASKPTTPPDPIAVASKPPSEPLPSPTQHPMQSLPGERALMTHPGLPLTRFAGEDFSGSGVCAACHSSLTDQAGVDVSIDAHWRSTVMANGARDLVWQAKVSSEVARRPDLQAVIEDKCTTCHMPMARTQSQVTDVPGQLLGDGFLDNSHPLHQAAMDGVSCTLCHQIKDTGLGESESFSGHYSIDTSGEPPNRWIHGPYAQPLQMPMAQASGFTPVEGLQVKDSGLCGSCHTLFTPIIDREGNVVGEFPEQTPYLEWEHSAYGDGREEARSCQECHMPHASGAVRISNRPGGRAISPRSPFAQHYFVGANVTLLRLLQHNVAGLGLTASTDLLQDTLDRTLRQLQTVTAEVSVDDVVVDGHDLVVTLDVRNPTGHKLPTGYPARQVWLHVTVVDASERVVFESGRPQPGAGISGNEADEHPDAFEPHYDVIKSADQVQVYEAVMQDSEGRVTYTLLRAVRYAKDNRLLPTGFDPGTASGNVAVQGMASLDETFVGGSDRVVYQVDVQGFSGPYTVSAELLYQSLSYRFVEDLRTDLTELGSRFLAYYDEADKSPVVLAAARRITGQVAKASHLLPLVVGGQTTP